jgi:hypothetical protein
MNRLIGKSLSGLPRGAFIAFLFTVLTACAGGITNHSFAFDARQDSPDIQILDYRYGDSEQPSVRADGNDVKAERVRQYVGISGDMLRGDFLYVKWRVKSSGRRYEDTVDLKSRLPRDIVKNEIYFIVQGAQLFVYLVTPELRAPATEPSGPREYQHRKVITLSSNFGREIASQ